MLSDALRVAVVGCGEISASHVDAILAAPDARLVAVCDSDQERLASAMNRVQCPGFSAMSEMLDQVRLDVVHLCTPHHRHADLAQECLTRNVSVLLEKPIAHTVAAGECLEAAAKDSRAILGVCFQNRYNDNAQRLHALLNDGALGQILGGRATVNWFRDAEYYARRPWRADWDTAGGGVLMNQAIHTLDLLIWLLGPVTEVRGITGTLALVNTIEVEDTAALQLQHRTTSGSTVGSVLHATNGHVENAPVSIEIVTEKAHARMDLDLRITYRDGRVETFEPTSLVSGSVPGPRAYWGDSHRRLIADFYHHVRAGQQFWINAPTAMESLRVIQSVYQQSKGLRP